MPADTSPKEPIPYRQFGRHSDQVSIIGIGGFHLGQVKTVTESVRIVHEAIDAGINFLDNAWEYHDGESEQRMGRAIADRRESVFLMTKVCTHGRDAKVAMRQLDESLRRLRTDHLDLWQIHECVYYNDPERHFAVGGVAEALLKAKAEGKVLGRPPSLTDDQRRAVEQRLEQGASVSALAREFNTSRNTIMRVRDARALPVP